MVRFAYVDLVSKEAMEKIMSRSEEALDGRHLLIKNGRNFEGRPAQRKQRYHVKSTMDQGVSSRKSDGRMEGRKATAHKDASKET
jgi:hypothetical protein